MKLRCRWNLVFALLLALTPRLAAAASAEEHDFELASRDLANGWYPQAEAEFAEFARNFTNSARLPEAFLFQAEARLRLPQPNYAGAIDLLASHQSQAGKWADQYLFWLAEVWLEKGEFQKARDLFGELMSRFPTSSRCLEAAIRQATAFSKLGDWPRVSELLQRSEGVFQSAIRTNLINQLTLQGYLLLGEALLEEKEYHAAGNLLRPLTPEMLEPKDAWRWQYLLCRVAQTEGRLEDAFQGTTNLTRLAALPANPTSGRSAPSFRAASSSNLAGPRTPSPPILTISPPPLLRLPTPGPVENRRIVPCTEQSRPGRSVA